MSETEQEQIPPPPPTTSDAMMEGSSASLPSSLKKEKSKKEKDAGDKKKKKKSKRDKGGGDTLENSSSMYGMEESSASFQREENSMTVAGGGRVTAPPSDQASPSPLLYSTSPREEEERREVENDEEVAVVAQGEASHISNTREANSAPPPPVPPPPAVPAPRKQNDYQQQDGGVAPGTVMDDEEEAALPQQPPSQQEEVPPLAPTESQNAGGSCGGGAWDQEVTTPNGKGEYFVGASGQTDQSGENQKKYASAGSFPINRYPIRNLKRAEVFFSITGWLLAFALWILTTVAVASIRENLRAANPRHHLLTATNAAVGSLTALSVVLVVMLGSQIYWMARVRDVVESATGTQVEVFGEVEEGGADGNTVGHSLRQRREDTSPTGGVEVLNSSVNAFLTPNAKLVHNEDGAGPATAGGSGSSTSSRIQELELRLKQKEAALTEVQSELARVRIDTLPKPPAKEEKEENAKPTAYLAHLLPQNIANGEEKQERQRQIMERQTQYEWSITETMPPCVKELPEHYKTVNMGSHFLDMFGPNTDLAQMKIIAACDQLKEKFGCKDETPFDDYVEVYPGKVEGGKWVVDIPKVAKTWQTDKEFGRQRLGGMNPVYCRKLTQGLEGVKDRFPITDDMVEGLTEGKTLAELDAAGKLYYTDYSRFYEEVKVMDGLNGTVYVPFCLFWTNSGGDMMPLGIAMYQDPSQSPIFTPNNDHDGLWLLVKICVQQMECSNHICTEHLGGMHLWREARYFFLHSCGNAVVTIAAFPDTYRALVTEPLSCFNGPSSTMVANSMVAAVHLYHCVAFNLRAEDIFHHLTFTAVLCGLAIPFKQNAGSTNNLGCFFLSGLPGGIDYFLLVLVKQGIMDKTTEKRWCANINVWLRGPAMSIYLFIGAQAYFCGSYKGPTIILLLVVALHFYNGQYYCEQAVASYAVHVERNKVAREEEKKTKALADGNGKERSSTPKRKQQ